MIENGTHNFSLFVYTVLYNPNTSTFVGCYIIANGSILQFVFQFLFFFFMVEA